MTNQEYAAHDAVGLAELVRSGQVTAGELVEAAIGCIEAQNPAINAVIHTRYERALAEARAPTPSDGPLAGVPFLLKDLSSPLEGSPMNSGSRLLRDHVATTDSELVRRYKKAGLLIIGKTNTPEFGLAPYTEPALHGATRNPWNLDHTPGGSSGGSAAAVAAGIVPAAHAGDGGGSIRIPASCCGLFGIKPTRGRTPSGPERDPHWNGAAVEHVIARSVRDSAAILDATAGADAGAPYSPAPPASPWLEASRRDPARLRIAFAFDPLLADVPLADDCRRALESTISLLTELGHSVEEAAPAFDRDIVTESFIAMIAAEIAAEVQEAAARVGRAPNWDDLEPPTWMLSRLGDSLRAGAVAMAIHRLQGQTRRIGRFFEDYDMLLTPTLAQPPVRVGALKPTVTERAAARTIHGLRAGWALKSFGLVRQMAAKLFEFVPFTPLFNVTGQPAMSVPLHWSEAGLPIGVQFVGRYGDETRLFELAGQLERARPWSKRRPPVSEQPVP